jgi:hypothetical protein
MDNCDTAIVFLFIFLFLFLITGMASKGLSDSLGVYRDRYWTMKRKYDGLVSEFNDLVEQKEILHAALALKQANQGQNQYVTIHVPQSTEAPPVARAVI